LRARKTKIKNDIKGSTFGQFVFAVILLVWFESIIFGDNDKKYEKNS
jgi:hypothetical protein